MSGDIHNNDDLFKKAYLEFEDEPSAETWEKLNAALDKKDALFYKSRSTTWRSIAAILFLLLGSAVSYHYFFAGKHSVQPINKQEVVEQNDGSQNHNQPKAPSSTLIEKDSAVQHEKQQNITSSSNKKNIKKLKNENHNADDDDYAVVANSKKNKYLKQNGDSNSDEIAGSNNDLENTNQKYQVPGVEADANKNNLPDKDAAGQTALNKTDTLVKNTDSSFRQTITENKPSENKQSLLQQSVKDASTKKYAVQKKRGAAGWSLLPYASFEWGGQRLDDDDIDVNNPDERYKIKQREHREAAFSGGFFIRRNFGNKLSLTSGLNLSEYAVSIPPQTLHAQQEGDDIVYKLQSSAGYGYVTKFSGQVPQLGDSLITSTTEFHLTHLQIPLMLGYNISVGKKISVVPNIGVTGNIYVHSRYEADYKKDNTDTKLAVGKLQGVNDLNFSLIANTEFQYKLSKNICFVLMPSFKTALSSVTKDNVVRTYPYSLGLGFGVSVNLNK